MSEEAPANAPVAPAEPSTPAAPAPETPAAPASEPQAQAPATAPAEGANSYFTNEQLAEMQSFIHNNGDFEKAWPRMKNAISRPQNVPEAPQAPQTVQQPAAQPQTPQNGSQQPVAGTYSMEELMVASQFEKYAAKP